MCGADTEKTFHGCCQGTGGLGKLHQVGPGNKMMAKRRVWAINEDQRMSRERGAQWLRRVEGVHSIRKGFFKTD